MNYRIICTQCGTEQNQDVLSVCGKCGGILKFSYNVGQGQYLLSDAPGIFKYAQWLPVDLRNAVSLLEGDTPLLQAKVLGTQLGLENVRYKQESSNPTGSFKDRGIAVSMTRAEAINGPVLIASSGNAAASVAAYAARAGRRAVVMVPEATPESKVMQCVLHGAKVLKVPGNYSRSYQLCAELARKTGWFNATTTFINPFAVEGYKTISHELHQQMECLPDWVVIPVGDGPILAAVYQGFQELMQAGCISRIPKLACVQAENCGPISSAFIRGTRVSACTGKPSIASGITDPLEGYTQDGEFTIDCIQQSGGTAVLLSESEIRQSMYLCASDGVYAEPAGSVGAFALKKLIEQGSIKRSESVVIVITGHGLKNPLKEDAIDISVVKSVDQALEIVTET